MELTYRTEGDYRLPNLEAPEAPKVGKYGMLRRSYLQTHRNAYYTGLLLSGRLNAHLEKIDRQATSGSTGCPINRGLRECFPGNQWITYTSV